MPSNQTNSPTPPPLDEAAMLAWIEGRLSKIEESKLIKQARPGTPERVAQMQANRRALQNVRDERAPAELMDRVLAALEREALVGLANGQDLFEHPPISIATVTKPKRRGWAQRNAPALALAAGLALLLSGAVYWGSLLYKPSKPETHAKHNETSLPPASPEAPKTLALNDDTKELSSPVASPNADAAKTAVEINDKPEAAPPAPTMTPGRMLALARQGRLVMRVQSRDLKNLAEIAAIENNAKIERSWHLSSSVPDQVVAMIVPKATPTAGSTPERTGPTMASAKDRTAALVTPLIGPGAGMTWALSASTDPASRVRAKFLVDMPNNEKTLNQIKVLFADRLKAGVVFEELDEPLNLPKVEDPETLLWWTLPPQQWVEHVTVPVVVEAR
jgi:hypothetical protein